MSDHYIELNEKRNVLRRLLFTCFILTIFIFGNHIVLLNLSKVDDIDKIFKMTAANIGGSFDIINIFSLGLGPWLTALIFTSLYYYKFPKSLMRITQFERGLRERLLTLILAIIQSFFLVRQAFIQNPNQIYDQWVVVLILVAGSMMLIWLADLNTVHGIAGAMPIVFISIIKSVIKQSPMLLNISSWILLIALICVMLAVIVLLVLELGEYRMVYKDIMMVSEPYQKPYVAWKINPSGSLSIMITISLFVSLKYILDFLMHLIGIDYSINAKLISFTSPIGIFIFIAMLFVFNYWLSIFILNPKNRAEMFEKSGNFFPYIHPGKDTEHFIYTKARRVSFVGAFVVTFIIGAPLFLILLYPKVSVEIYLAIQIIMIVYITLNMKETVKTLLYFDKYDGFLKKYW